MKLNKIAAALGAVALGLSLAGPASAQTGDSKSDPRNRSQGVTDNPNTSTNPVGSPNSTAANRCSHLMASSKEHADCMSNLRRGASAGASGTTRSDRPAARTTRGSNNEGRGVSSNPNTSQNPNTGGSQVNRGGDSNIKSNPGVNSSGGSSGIVDRPAASGSSAPQRATTDNPNTSQNPGTGGSQMNRGGDSKQ